MSQMQIGSTRSRVWITWAWVAVACVFLSASSFIRADAWYDFLTGAIQALTAVLLAVRAAYGRKHGV